MKFWFLREQSLQVGHFVKWPKWPDKSTTSYDMLDFKSYVISLTRKYLVIGRHMLQIPRHTSLAISKVYFADIYVSNFLYNF